MIEQVIEQVVKQVANNILVEDYLGSKLLVRNLPEINLLTAQKQLDGSIIFDIRDFINFKYELDKKGILNRESSYKAWEKIDGFLKKISRIQDIKLKKNDMPLPLLIKHCPYTDQWPGIYMFLARQFVGNWDVMGCGKTFMALCAFAFLKEHGLAERALVICPNQVKLLWSSEISKHTGFNATIVGNGTKEILFDLGTFVNQDILVVHYDCLLNWTIFSELIKIPVDLIILDEAHYVKNLSALRTKRVLELFKCAKRLTPINQPVKIEQIDMEMVYPSKPFLWCLTGTPVSESPENSFVLLKLLDPNFKISLWQFERFFNIYVDIKVKGRKIRKLVGYKNIEHLKSFFETFSIRRKREELQDMPEKIISDRILIMPEKQFDIYQIVRKGIIEELKKYGKKINISRLENILLRLHQVANHPGILDIEGPSVKHQEILVILDEIISSGGQAIVWCIFRKGAELLLKLLQEANIPVALIYGGTELNEIEQIQNEFETEKIKVIIASIKKMGTGIDFLKKARNAIYLDLPFSYVEYIQSQNRLIRRGVSTSALLIRLIIENTVDDLIRAILDRKQQMVSEIIDSDIKDEDNIEVEVDEVIQGI